MSHKLVQTTSTQNNENTLYTEFGLETKDILPAGGLTKDTYKKKLKKLHTSDVRADILNSRHNPVLNEPTPSIYKYELKLPRKTRSTISELRSGYSSYLNSYLSRISSDNSVQNKQTPYDTTTCSAIQLDLPD